MLQHGLTCLRALSVDVCFFVCFNVRKPFVFEKANMFKLQTCLNSKQVTPWNILNHRKSPPNNRPAKEQNNLRKTPPICFAWKGLSSKEPPYLSQAKPYNQPKTNLAPSLNQAKAPKTNLSNLAPQKKTSRTISKKTP